MRTAKELYESLNIIERQKFVEMFAKQVLSKFDQETITKRREAELLEQGFQDGVDQAFAIMIDMYWNHWRETVKKDERLKIAYELFTMKLLNNKGRTDKQKEAEEEFFRQTGLKKVEL